MLYFHKRQAFFFDRAIETTIFKYRDNVARIYCRKYIAGGTFVSDVTNAATVNVTQRNDQLKGYSSH